MTRLNRTRSLLGVALALGAFSTTALAQAEGRARIDTTFAFNKGGSVELGIVSGIITVTGSILAANDMTVTLSPTIGSGAVTAWACTSSNAKWAPSSCK